MHMFRYPPVLPYSCDSPALTCAPRLKSRLPFSLSAIPIIEPRSTLMAEQAATPCAPRCAPVYWFPALDRCQIPPPEPQILPSFTIRCSFLARSYHSIQAFARKNATLPHTSSGPIIVSVPLYHPCLVVWTVVLLGKRRRRNYAVTLLPCCEFQISCACPPAL